MAKLLAGPCAAQSFRELADLELIQSIFQRTLGYPKVLRSARHSFLERARSMEVAFERIRRIFEEIVGPSRLGSNCAK